MVKRPIPGRRDRGHHQRLALLAGAEQAAVDPPGDRHPASGGQLGPLAADQQETAAGLVLQEQAAWLDPDEALEKIVRGQRPVLQAFYTRMGQGAG